MYEKDDSLPLEMGKIKNVVNSSKPINPLLLNIDNRAVTEDELENCECAWYNDKTDSSTRVIKFTNSSQDNYQGTTQLNGNLYKNMLVIQNKKTNKIQLVEIGKCQLGRVFEKGALCTEYDNDEMHLTYEENKAQLLKAFGSKKSNRVSEIGSKMRINSKVMVSQLKNTAADVDVDVKELELACNNEDMCVPLIHRDAPTADSVYLVEDFLDQRELDSMEDEAFTVLHLLPFTPEQSGYSKFFIDSLERLQNKIDIDRIKIMLFVEALLRFFREKSEPLKTVKEQRKITAKVCPFSQVVGKKLVTEYMVEGRSGRYRNITMNDKIVIHAMALIVIACETFNADELSRSLPSFSVTKIGQIARTLCLSTRDKVNWFVKLPLPPRKSFYMKKRK